MTSGLLVTGPKGPIRKVTGPNPNPNPKPNPNPNSSLSLTTTLTWWLTLGRKHCTAFHIYTQ